MNAIRRPVACLLFSTALHAGILISRSGQGLQFADASSILLNAKDKALNLGPQAKLPGPINKLPNVKLGATVLMDADSRTPALYDDGVLSYLLPEGLPKTATGEPGELWKSVRISYKKAPNDKTPTDIPVAEFVAYLSGGAEELVRLCKDTEMLQMAGGKGKTLATQLEFLAAAAKAFPTDSAVATLDKYVEQAMRQRYERFESGTAGVEVLEQGLKFAALSDAIYSKQPAHMQLRKALLERRAWLDRKIAILHAFSAAQEYDAFLLGDRDFEKYQQAFPEIQKKHADALSASLQLHKQNGETLLKDREFGPAWREFRLASLRQPSDKLLQQNVFMAWTDYSRQVAIDRKGKRKQLTAGQRNVISQALLFATRYKDANKLDDALKSVQEAEAIDPDSLQVLLKKAEVLGARHEFSRALAALDEYDMRAVDEERDPASKLRSELLYQRTSTAQDMKTQFQKAWSEGSFYKAHNLALQGLQAQDDDAELLYNGGVSALVVRNPKETQAFFTRYLEMANSLDASAEQRLKVRSMLPSVKDTAEPANGAPNWLSGKKLPPGVYYDPVSLAFQPHVERIEASGKFKVSFEWDGDRLRAIVPTFEKAERSTGERKISFAYDPQFPQVNAVGYEDGARGVSGSDPDEIYKRSSVLLLNNRYVDPAAIQKFTGKNVAVGIGGNRFLEPFVWDRIHYFHLTYDDSGRVAQAREAADPSGPGGDFWLEFEWDGLQLDAIYGYQGKDESHRSKVYEREMQYQDGRLVGEEIQSQGKTSRIRYTYNAGRLVSANCDKDASLDDRSRVVTFR